MGLSRGWSNDGPAQPKRKPESKPEHTPTPKAEALTMEVSPIRSKYVDLPPITLELPQRWIVTLSDGGSIEVFAFTKSEALMLAESESGQAATEATPG